MKTMVCGLAMTLLLASGGSEGRAPAPSASEVGGGCRTEAVDIDEAAFVEIGGLRQWITVEGRDRGNPLILVVHGGPGNPNTPYAQAIYADWLQEFTVAQWDQRGAGKTHAENPDAKEAPLTMERMARDGIEVAEYLVQRFGKRKVILTGGSWGSALAVHMAHARPDLFHAYVGTSQLVGFEDSTAASYALVLGLAQKAGDQDVVESLESGGSAVDESPRLRNPAARCAQIRGATGGRSPQGVVAAGPRLRHAGV